MFEFFFQSYAFCSQMRYSRSMTAIALEFRLSSFLRKNIFTGMNRERWTHCLAIAIDINNFLRFLSVALCQKHGLPYSKCFLLSTSQNYRMQRFNAIGVFSLNIDWTFWDLRMEPILKCIHKQKCYCFREINIWRKINLFSWFKPFVNKEKH